MLLLFSGFFVVNEWSPFIHFGETLNQNPRRARSLYLSLSRVPHHIQWSIRLFLCCLWLSLVLFWLCLLRASRAIVVDMWLLFFSRKESMTYWRLVVVVVVVVVAVVVVFGCRSLGQNSWLWRDRYLVASSVFLQFATVVGDPWFAAAAAMGSGSVFYSSSVVFIGGEQSFSRVLIGLLLLLVLLLRPFTVCFPSLFPLFLGRCNEWMNECMLDGDHM